MSQTSTPPGSNYYSEIFSASHIKFTNNNPNKDFESVKRPLELDKFKLDRQIFSCWKIKSKWCVGFERMTSLPMASNRIH